MNFKTEPIRNIQVVENVLMCMKEQSYRNYMIAKVQLNTACRISDVISLKVSDFYTPSLRIKTHLCIKEEKRENRRKIALNKSLKTDLRHYIKVSGLSYNSCLFSSRKGKNTPITITQVERIYKKVAIELNLDDFSTHSLRKTWGYQAYKETKDIATIMQAYGHKKEKDTLIYIGIIQENIDELYKKIVF